MPKEPKAPSPSPSATQDLYETPAIVWEDSFPTTVFGLSCAKQEGIPRCESGGNES